ncbi:hypothetical protein M231_00700 [Tremella mesenterica]|uniref:Thioesterase domain-containing protein n=1 Tax=Tremella mesenterica TaxID=5217 RepID=A0A4Q1BV16_TREME|nr:hypothetical protein M231_00700 [Tremella mesenterica]
MSACRKFVQTCWQYTISKGGADHNVLSNLEILSARPGYLKASLLVEKRHLNNHKTVHGGVLLSLTDTITSLCLSTHGIPAPTGVSVNVSCEFVRPAGKEGDIIICSSEVVRLGRTMAYTRINFLDSQERIVAFGSHTKHMGNNISTTSFSSDGEHEVPLPSKAKL